MNLHSIPTLRGEVRKMSKLAAPIIGAQLLIQSMTFVDNVMVGQLGPEALAALAVAGSLYSMIMVVAMGALGAISPLVTHSLAESGPDHMGHVARQSLIFALALSAVVSVILSFCEPILALLGQSENLIAISSPYLRIMMLTVPAHFAMIALRHIAEGHEDSLPGFIILAVAALANIPLDYVLIHGHYGFPKLGVMGAAVATALLAWLSLGAYIIYLTFHSRYSSYRLWRGRFKADLRLMLDLLRIGLPLGGAIGIEMTFFASTTLIMGTIGTTELAAHQIALNAASMVFMIPLGMSFAVSIRVGLHRGRGNQLGARRAWQASIVITLLTQALTAIFFFATPEWIISLYSQSGDVALLGVRLLFVAAFFQLFDGMQAIGIGALRGMKDTTYALIATFISFWCIGSAVIGYAYFFQEKSVEGIWAGLLIGLGVAGLFHHIRMEKRTRISLNAG
jgi:MATE family multidrug resistance protein